MIVDLGAFLFLRIQSYPVATEHRKQHSEIPHRAFDILVSKPSDGELFHYVKHSRISMAGSTVIHNTISKRAIVKPVDNSPITSLKPVDNFVQNCG